MPIVKFINEKKEIEVPEGANLRKEAIRAGIGVYRGLSKYLNCRGMGLCGTCRVLIKKGMENTSPMSGMEKFKFKVPVPDPFPCLAYIGNEEEMRLACKTQVNGDIEVETKPAMNMYGENFYS